MRAISSAWLCVLTLHVAVVTTIEVVMVVGVATAGRVMEGAGGLVAGIEMTGKSVVNETIVALHVFLLSS